MRALILLFLFLQPSPRDTNNIGWAASFKVRSHEGTMFVFNQFGYKVPVFKEKDGRVFYYQYGRQTKKVYVMIRQ